MRVNKKERMLSLLFILVLGLGIGYAVLSSNLSIDGTSLFKKATFDIHFEDVNITTGSVTPNSGPTIGSNLTSVTYNITLTNPGDFFEFTVDAVNGGTIDAMISSVTSKMNGTVITTLPNYMEYSVTYSDGIAIANNDLLAAGDEETYKVRVAYKDDINPNDLPGDDTTSTFQFSVNYVQADENGISVMHPISFSTDDWPTIIAAVQRGNTNAYHVGDTKEVALGNSLGTHTLRIANKSTPAECSTTGFSQTACGFVLEFSSIFASFRIDTNVGGWPASEIRTYVNTDIYNSLPEVLKNAIINTTVVSGHGSDDSNNFTSTDKLYLLSDHEVYEDDDGDTSRGMDHSDTAYYNSRQLDYYAGLNVTSSSYSGAIKQHNALNTWWLRSPFLNLNSFFQNVNSNGDWNSAPGSYKAGVSPAFRIG